MALKVTSFASKLKIKEEIFVEQVGKKNIPSHLKESLIFVIKKEGFLTFTVKATFIEPFGGNYTAELYLAQIKGNTGKGYKEINLFIKSILPFGNDLGFITLKDIFLREKFVYAELQKIFEELQMKSKVPDSEKFDFVNYYDTSNEKALIMDNLSLKGFKAPKRLAIPSLQYCEKAIIQLARFHSLSLATKKEKREFYDKEIKTKRILIHENDTWLAMLNNSAKNAIDALKTDTAKERLTKYLSSVNLLEKFKYYSNNDDINIGVFCHGDYKTQNILMRKKDDASIEVMPLDYQLTYYGHPVNDIIFFIFGATDKEFRKNHLNHLTSLYYETMQSYLPYFNIKVEDVYPREQYEHDFKERLDYAIFVGIHFLPIFFAPEDDFLDFSMDMTTEKVPQSDLYIQCWNELVEDLINVGTL